ncbi:MAG: hypothetical protein NT015_12100 [Alphaproteobacteria bacterium]|nr:hypothetical protein [Alphaproteobacteria bacterium]
MRQKSFLALFLALTALALSAVQTHAQEAPPTPFQNSQALIERFEMSDLFVPIESDSVGVRHSASGLVCHFFGTSTRSELLVFEGAPRGEDVGCLSTFDGKVITLYATRYSPPISVDEALQHGIAGIRHSFPGAQPTPATLSFSSEGAPTALVAHFVATRDSERWFTSVMVAESNGWIYKLRYSALAPESEQLVSHELEAGAVFALALAELSRAPSP